MTGDNGFLDVLLNTGILGLALFLLVYLQMWGRSLRYMSFKRNLLSLFVPLFMLYTLLANLNYSLFMETDVFVCLLIITLMVIMAGETRGNSKIRSGVHELHFD